MCVSCTIKHYALRKTQHNSGIDSFGNIEWPGASPVLNMAEHFEAILKDAVETLMMQEQALGSSIDNYPAFADIGLRENSGKTSTRLNEEFRNNYSEIQKWLKRFFGLSYLHPEEISDVSMELVSDAPVHRECIQFTDYILTNYIDTSIFPPILWAAVPEIGNVMTANAAEAFYSKLDYEFYKHYSPIFTVIDVFKQQHIVTTLKKTRELQTGGRVTKRSAERKKENFIIQYQRQGRKSKLKTSKDIGNRTVCNQRLSQIETAEANSDEKSHYVANYIDNKQALCTGVRLECASASIRRPEFECSGPQLEGPEFECSGPQLEGPEFECSGPQLEGPEFEYSELSLKYRLERVKWTDRIRNEAVLERMDEERKMLKMIRERIIGSLVDKKLTSEGCTERNGEREKSSEQKKISDDRRH
ncbi:hypothetical protein ANN_08161 [Periplaneta americana]|uniref:Uncharacterized protein n=1 Tax=Periplaneta americana TaxID=6978 RepID=A0ABQ8T281_PERAM|nr:hypothetical protein ANN_08161 [Periplaneta americana]